MEVMDMVEKEEKEEKCMNDENKIDLMLYIQRILLSLKRTWKLGIILILLSCIIQIFGTWYHYRPMYESKVTFSVIKEYNGSSSFTYNKEATERLAGSFLTIIESDLMVNAICQDMKVDYIPARFRIERIASTNLFSVYAQSGNAKDAKDTLDALTRNYSQISKVALNDAALTVIEEPVFNTTPVNQISYPYLLMKGIILGIGIYAIIVLLYTFIRKTITNESDISMYLHSKELCSLPKLKIMKGKDILISQPLRDIGSLKDSFHKLRLEIENEAKEKQSKVFMFTSCMPHEGKSTIVSNTALSLAGKGNKVLVLDFDFRNPTQCRHFQLDGNNGKKLSYLFAPLFCFNKVENMSLDIISVVDVMENTSEALSSKEVEKLFEQIRSDYDYILIDTPPLETMADTSIIARYADSYILVIKEDYVSVNMARDCVESLSSLNGNLLGCVLNQCEQHGLISYYGYRYGRYGYRYHYGYGKYGK